MEFIHEFEKFCQNIDKNGHGSLPALHKLPMCENGVFDQL